jgi:oligopeptide transport system ATP-binding protein
MNDPVLQVDGLKVRFESGGGLLGGPQRAVRAVDGVSFELHAGETLGVVGESGCGKSTLARAILGLVPTSAGRVTWLGNNITGLSNADMRPYRRELQVIFQDPLASLNPRMTVGESIAEPLKTFEPGLGRDALRQRVQDIMALCGLLPSQVNRYPHEFSGGQCQRIGIARALVCNPKLVICDEPVSALDVSIQAQIINLLMDLQQRLGIALIFIAHDLAVVRHISHRVMVMYLGKVMEVAPRDELYRDPRHPYTRALIDAVPIPDPAIERHREGQVLEGDLPSPSNPPSGCVFRTRCPHAIDRCAAEVPALEARQGRYFACIRAGEI